MRPRKRVTWFIDPETIRLVKAEAAMTDGDQSTVVQAALDRYLAGRDGLHQSRPRRKLQPATTA